MAKAANAAKDESAPGKGKAARRFGVATVARPCLAGALMLSALHVVLGH